ncbi:MAG: DUF1223 domain-containing protein [Pseudomonadota bacterium]|nr:DUF1223 domain-containing protein [Pseudomonadota bacterium]
MPRLLLPVTAIVTALIVAALGFPVQKSAKTSAQPANNAPVLLELFTSQGCSSCPPADRLAAKFDEAGEFIVISRPVDYWDRLGWKDTFASPENTALQRSYSQRGLVGYNGVYTPQAVLAGHAGEVGSDANALRKLAASLPDTGAAISIRAVPGKGHAVGLAGSTSRAAELVLVGVSRRETVRIGRGENGGRSVTYTNVALEERRIDNWNGGSKSIELGAENLSVTGADRYALILRQHAGGEVMAASWLD